NRVAGSRNARRHASRYAASARSSRRIRDFATHRPESLQRPLRRGTSRGHDSAEGESDGLLLATSKELRWRPVRSPRADASKNPAGSQIARAIRRSLKGVRLYYTYSFVVHCIHALFNSGKT